MYIIEKDWKWNGNFETRNSTKYIVIHHAKSRNCTAEDVHRWHQQENGWLGIGYHYFLAKNGKIIRGRPEKAMGAHTLGYNDKSIGICLEGDFDIESVTDAQKTSLKELLRHLLKTYKKAKIVRHKDVNQTSCPGSRFDENIILDAMKTEDQEHWAEKHYQNLNTKGIKIHERRFDDSISRGELFAVLDRMTDK